MNDNVFDTQSNLKKYYAGQALIGLLAHGRPSNQTEANDNAEALAKEAFEIAEAMIKESQAHPAKRPTTIH